MKKFFLFVAAAVMAVNVMADPIELGLFGSYEFMDLGAMKIYEVKAATMMGESYAVDIPVMVDELVSGSTYSIADETIHYSANITTPSGTTLALEEAVLELTYLELEQMYLLQGTLKDENGQVYKVQIGVNLPEGPQSYELNFYNTVLSEDEGDIKFKYQNEEYQLICYLKPVAGDDLSSMTLVGGEYEVLSYSKFGPMGEFGYELVDLVDAKASVEVSEDATVLTLTFTQNGDEYTIVASTGAKPKIVVEQSEVAIYDWNAPEYTIVTMAYPTDWTFQLSIVANEGLAEGEYELGEYDNVADGDYVNTYNFVPGSKITLTKGTDWKGDDCWIISGELVATDGSVFDITLSTAPAQADVNLEKVVAENATVVCNFRTEKWSIEAAFGAESKDTIRLQFANAEYAGEYTETYDLGWDNLLVYGEDVADEIETVSLKAEEEGDDIHVTGWIILYSYDTDKTYYVPVDLKGAMVEEDPAEGDEQSDLTVTLQKVNLVDYGWNFDFSASNEEGYELVLMFSWGVSLEDGKLPAGELPISADQDIDARIVPSIEIPEGGYGPGPLSLEDEGEEETPVPDGSYITDGEKFWFLYEGSATIAYNEEGALQMVINAKNTAGNVLTITIDEDPSLTGCENAEAAVKVVKAVENGQLIINRGGEKYNVVGAKL